MLGDSIGIHLSTPLIHTSPATVSHARGLSQTPSVCPSRAMRRSPAGDLGSDGLPIVQRAASSRPAKPQQQQPLLDSGTPRSDGTPPTPPPRKTPVGRNAVTMPKLPLPTRSGSLRPPRGSLPSRAEDDDLVRSDGTPPTLPPRKTPGGRTDVTMPKLPLPKPLSGALRPPRGSLPSRAEDGDLEETAQERPSSTPLTR